MKRKKTKKMKKKIKKTEFPDLVRLPKHSHFKHFFSAIFYKLKCLIQKCFKTDQNFEVEKLKMKLLYQELQFTLLQEKTNFELTVLRNEIEQLKFSKLINQK